MNFRFHVIDYDSDFDLSGVMWGKKEILTDHHSIGSGLVLAYKGHPQADSITLLFTEFRGKIPALAFICLFKFYPSYSRMSDL